MDDPFADLPEKDRTARSVRMLETWIHHAEQLVGVGGERTRWILASTIVAAVLQRTVDGNEVPLFLVKGGVYIERALNLKARATKDLDMIYRGAVADFEKHVDEAIASDWGIISFSRGRFTSIENAPLTIKPRRFDMRLDVLGKRWASVQVEVSFVEGAVGDHVDRIPSPSTQFFGIDQPADIATITMAYQVAQKFHACTDPHDPPQFAQLRVRDIVDLYLIREAFHPDGVDLADVRGAASDIFAARAEEATLLGRTPRTWPPTIVPNEQWEIDWARPAGVTGITLTLEHAIANINEWITAIDAAQ